MSLNKISVSLIALFSFITPAISQIESGNSVQISIMGVPGEEKAKIDSLYAVSESGTVNLPFIGNIRAAGMRPENLAVVIQNAYKAAQIYNNPTIQVISTTAGSGVANQIVTIGGQVGKTGPVAYNKDLTIYGAVQAAGGASTFGSLKRVKLYRDGKIFTYDLTNPQFMHVKLQPNDTLEVPQKNWFGQ